MVPRVQFDSFVIVTFCFFKTPRLAKVIGKIDMSHPGSRILSDRITPKSFKVIVYPSLPPRRCPQCYQETSTKHQTEQRLVWRNKPHRGRDYGSGHCQRPNGGQILKVIAYKRVTEEHSVEEA